MAINIELVDTLNHPVEQVYALLTDISRHPEWIEEMETITRPPELPLRVGSSYDHTAKYFGRTVTITMEVIALEPNKLLRFKSTGTMPTVTTWRLEREGTDGNSTRLHFIFEGEPGELYDMIAPGLEGSIKRGFEAQIASLQKLLVAA